MIRIILLLCAKSLQLWLTFCGPIDSNLPGSYVRRILQARILEWAALLKSLNCIIILQQLVICIYGCL